MRLTRNHSGLTLIVFIALLLSLLTNKSFAHPHAWIEIKSTLLFNKAGEIEAIKQQWLFDEFYTEFMIHDFGLKKNGVLDTAKLQSIAEQNLKNLHDYSYFTFMDSDEKRIDFKNHSDVSSTIEGQNIVLNFTISLKKPINPRTKKVSYRIYDPSYYIEMLHAEKDGFNAMGNSTSCALTREQPKPNAAYISLAAAMDKNAKATEDLGGFFAERIHIDCNEKKP
ncbi:MAG: DUF1007 family protein [Holosporales bacterium]|jgi:ABC-type uncharacterized transport system substrate-binding protein